ncbi:hypothetical protein RIF29_39745 [Crotalaria pallida]|uniref:AB hydrolase-1 domain-containing protein n=1 Tax=Crotalaria pallida TaxID=3830 RepID=A0AAN9E3F4_CROPI
MALVPSGIRKKTLAVLFIGFLAWAYKAIQPPPPKICGSPDGPPVTAPRIKLRDERYLAYKEHGVPRDAAKYKIVFVHGIDACRHDAVVAETLSPDVAKDLGVYIVSFDRPGYGESDPDPNLTLKSLALDIEELADKLRLGSKFYIIGHSLGGLVVWGCLKYIPHRRFHTKTNLDSTSSSDAPISSSSLSSNNEESPHISADDEPPP